MKKLLTVLLLCLLPISLISCDFGEEHTHSFVSRVTQEATCGAPGIMAYDCSECDESYSEEIPATGNHTFDSWTQSSSTSMYRTCTSCGLVETAPLVGGDTSIDASAHSYTSFLSFSEDCIENGSTLTYNGQSNKIIVSLGGGNSTSSCDNKKIIIPARVSDVQLIGLASGSPFSNFQIEFEERVNDVNLTFNDVRIESNYTILTSLSRNINFNIKMLGNTCSFINVKTGADGADGSDGTTNDTDRVYGKDGESGRPAFEIKGKVTIYSQASLLEIQGGDGGNGGKGGHIITSKAPSGGDGGNGGNAIDGEELATVYVSADCNVNIQGGHGGKGGKGGSSDVGYFGGNRTGASGDDGTNGISGCEIIFN